MGQFRDVLLNLLYKNGVKCTIYIRLDYAILMCANNIHLHDNI